LIYRNFRRIPHNIFRDTGPGRVEHPRSDSTFIDARNMTPIVKTRQPKNIHDDEEVGCGSCPVRRLDLFAGLSDHRAGEMLRGIDHLDYAARAPIYPIGERIPFVYVVREGLIKLSHSLPNGAERIVRILEPGDTAGLEALFGDPYHHTAVTLTPAHLCRVPVALLEQLDREVPDFHRQLLRQFQRSLYQAEAVLTNLSTGTAHGRVARLLLFLARNHGTHSVTLISREDMGAILGITTESASRIVAQFRRNGALTDCKGSVCTGNLSRLAELARDADAHEKPRRVSYADG
jgi:CRP/FNR family transcriptional regulator